MKLNEGYREIDELARLADAIIHKLIDINLPRFVKYINTKEPIKNLLGLEVSYDILYDNKNLVNSFKYIANFINNIITKPHHEITINLNLTNIYEAQFIKGGGNPEINIDIDTNPFQYALKFYYDAYNNLNKDTVKIIFNKNIRSMLIHELQHAYDDSISKGRNTTDKNSKKYYNTLEKKSDEEKRSYENMTIYYNLPHEYWARFSEFISSKPEKYFNNSDFNDLLDDFKSDDNIKFNRIQEIKDKKRLIISLYKYWYLKNKE